MHDWSIAAGKALPPIRFFDKFNVKKGSRAPADGGTVTFQEGYDRPER